MNNGKEQTIEELKMEIISKNEGRIMAGYFCDIEKCGGCGKIATIVSFSDGWFDFWCKECWEEETKKEPEK